MTMLRLVLGLGGLLLVVLGMSVPALVAGTLFEDPVFTFVIVASCGPFLIYLAIFRSPQVSLVTGWALLTATGLVYVMVLTSEHSTAAAGFVGALILDYLIVGIGVAFEVHQRQTNRSSKRS